MGKPFPIDDLRPRSEADDMRLRDAGFRWGGKGTHTSRSIMLDELRLLLTHCQADATRDEYLAAIQDDNCLGKRTAATRRRSFQRLSELYALDPDATLFRVMRRCWYADRNGQSLLAMLLSLALDPLLRITLPPILRMRPGEELGRQQVTDADRHAGGTRLSDSTLDKVVRNAASLGTQSGHLKGRGRKIRTAVVPTAVTAAFALWLGYLVGQRGTAMFKSLWGSSLADGPSASGKGTVPRP